MNQKQVLLASFVIGLPLGSMGCGNQIAQQDSETASEETGTLNVVANGEDIIREGLTTKDGWEIKFDHAYVTLNNIKAHQTDPPFDANSEEEPQPTTSVTLLESAETIDLLSENPTPMVAKTEAPAGMYNAFYWEIVSNQDGNTEGSTITLEGIATKEGRNLDFMISFDHPIANTCGEYVGEERKGILEAGGEAELEATFHFDHLFGISDLPADDPMNEEALGFDPFVEYAEGDSINVDSEQLQENLDEASYETLVSNLTNLGHVGEGHCRVKNLES